ncbi:hypothetical protein BDZ89DRAFT_1137719 [Hymenopellis radicata]|nr:hypothetical protein BDZ89DRAFT_1145346 [Hymenopellis radicata]KAF9021893.1 hypothetical protein BDZ89DRAFT_1137719 [Hymenopellis radicata]
MARCIYGKYEDCFHNVIDVHATKVTCNASDYSFQPAVDVSNEHDWDVHGRDPSSPHLPPFIAQRPDVLPERQTLCVTAPSRMLSVRRNGRQIRLQDLENRLPRATPRLARVEKALECPCCQDTLLSPETWCCVHALCKACWIDLEHKKPLSQALPIECPVCQDSFVENPIQNRVVEQVIEELRRWMVLVIPDAMNKS